MSPYQEQEESLAQEQAIDITSKISISSDESEGSRLKKYFIFWLITSIILTAAIYYRIPYLRNMDIPAHIFAGAVIASVIFETAKIKNCRKALAIAFVPFIVWEIIEIITASMVSSAQLHGLFYETAANKTQDVTMDAIGFLIFMISTKRKF